MGELEHISRILEQTGLYEPSDGSLLRAELAAYAEGLDLYFDELEALLRECFIATAQSYGITLREQLMGRMSFAGSNLTKRRNALLRGFSVNSGDFTTEGMMKVLESFGLTGSFSFSQQQFLLTVHPSQNMTTASKRRLKAEIKELLPCWVDVEIGNPVS